MICIFCCAAVFSKSTKKSRRTATEERRKRRRRRRKRRKPQAVLRAEEGVLDLIAAALREGRWGSGPSCPLGWQMRLAFVLRGRLMVLTFILIWQTNRKLHYWH